MSNRRQFVTSVITLPPAIQLTTSLAKAGTIIHVADFNVVADGLNDDSTALQAAIIAAQNNELHIAKGTYLCRSSLLVPSNSRITLDPQAVLIQPNKGLASTFTIAPNSQNIVIQGGKLYGPYRNGMPTWLDQTTNKLSNGDTWQALAENIGIHIQGRWHQREIQQLPLREMKQLTDESRNISIRNIEIMGFGQSGILADQVTDCQFINNIIHQCGRDGIRLYGAKNCQVMDNKISDIAPGYGGAYPNWNVYGITCTRIYGKLPDYPDPDLRLFRASRQVKVEGNTISNCATWKSLDTHGGVDIQFIENTVINSYIGIGVDSGGDRQKGFAPPKNIYIKNNSIISNNQARYKRAGISLFCNASRFTGKQTLLADNFIVEDNTLDGYGGDNTDGAISLSNVQRVYLKNNRITNYTRCAVCANDIVQQLNIVGNTLTNAYPYLAILLTNKGQGYQQPPQTIITPTNSKLKAVAKLKNNQLNQVDIVYLPNASWTQLPNIEFQGNATLLATAIIKRYLPVAIMIQSQNTDCLISNNNFQQTNGISFYKNNPLQINASSAKVSNIRL